MSPISASLVTVLLYVITITHATTITVLNNCDYIVWTAADPGGGKQLAKGNTWDVNPPPGTKTGRIWGRTGCNFDVNGNGSCQTGGCGKLVCDPGNMGTIPKTLFEYALVQPNNPTDDIADISLIEGFNIPMSFSPSTGTGSLGGKCRTISCTAVINGLCPKKWKVPGGCNNPCTTQGIGTCGANGGSRFYKQRCPDTYSFPENNGQTSTFGCPGGTNYSLTFCP